MPSLGGNGVKTGTIYLLHTCTSIGYFFAIQSLGPFYCAQPHGLGHRAVRCGAEIRAKFLFQGPDDACCQHAQNPPAQRTGGAFAGDASITRIFYSFRINSQSWIHGTV